MRKHDTNIQFERLIFSCCRLIRTQSNGRIPRIIKDSENTFATQKEMTWTHPNQSLDTLIFQIILNSIWQFAAFPYIQAVRKAAKHQNKNLSSKSALLIPTVSTSAFHSTNLFLFSRHHIPTNSVTPFSNSIFFSNPLTTQNSSNRSNKGLTLEASGFQLFTVVNLRFQLIL